MPAYDNAEKTLPELKERVLKAIAFVQGITAAQMLLTPLRDDPPSHLIVDLAGVRYFGSAFITFLLRCHLLVKKRGSELVLAGVNPRIRELLRTTALDTLWALYDTRQEAIDVLPFDAHKIVVAPNAVDDCFAPAHLSAQRSAIGMPRARPFRAAAGSDG